MSDSILVAYASRTGTTAGVAQAIGDTLARGGRTVEVMPMVEVADVTAYRAVVAGSAIQDHEWLPEARQFLSRHRAGLVQRPFAAFMVCMTLSLRRADRYRPALREWMEPVRALVPTVSEGYFAGSLDLEKIPGLIDRLKFRGAVALRVWKPGDHRDWAAIRSWAESLPPLLGG